MNYRKHLLLWFILPVSIVIMAWGLYNQSKCSLKSLLDHAPETLFTPQKDQFIDEDSYTKALNRFNQYGTWATLENGTTCKL